MNHLNANKIEALVSEFCVDNHLFVRLPYEMPAGYETAFGTYDVTINTLFLNLGILQDAPEYEVLFYLYHELRHAVQYLHPEVFDTQIQESRFYVVLYNGTCYKLVGNDWQECALEGDESYFTNAYLSLPYEVDANAYAYEKVKALCGDSLELLELYNAWVPEERWAYEKLKALFCRINGALNVYGDKISEKCGKGRDEAGDAGKIRYFCGKAEHFKWETDGDTVFFTNILRMERQFFGWRSFFARKPQKRRWRLQYPSI